MRHLRHQVGLELVKIHIEGAIETQRGRNGGHDLRDEAVEVGQARLRDVQVLLADVVDRLVVNLFHMSANVYVTKRATYHEGAVRVLERRVRRENRVVRLDDGVRHLRRRVDAELELRLLAVVGGKALKEKSTETRASSTAKGVEDEEALETGAVISETAGLVHDG